MSRAKHNATTDLALATERCEAIPEARYRFETMDPIW